MIHLLIIKLIGILARNIPSDEADLVKQNINKIDIVVCNLYPFKDTISKEGISIAEAIEEIDIGENQLNS